MATLADVLGLDVFRLARPVFVHGEHHLSREVHWVRTSELVEAATLLRGGELLLATGLGLARRGPVAQQNYIAEMARKGATV